MIAGRIIIIIIILGFLSVETGVANFRSHENGFLGFWGISPCHGDAWARCCKIE